MKKIVTLFAFILIISITKKSAAQLINFEGKDYLINGLNIPWNMFSRDFGTNPLFGANQYDSSAFENILTQCESYGVNCVRIWIHNDGSASPEIDTTTGYVIGLDSDFFPNMDDFLNRALKHKIMVIPSIWDFSMTNNDYALGPNGGMHADIIQDTAKTNSYINNALIPMVQRYANQCNLLAWEIINEPEWSMNVQFGGTMTQVVNASEMQRFVGMIAEAIHQNSTKMVTVGSASLRYNSDKFDITTPCLGNYWKDQAIQSAYNKPLAHLDFYQIHYYDWMNGLINFDPYKGCCPESYWLLDKPTLIGESQGSSTKHSTTDQLYNSFVGNYAGVLFWSYTAGADSMGSFTDFNDELLAFRNTGPGIIDFDSASCNPINTRVDQSLKENLITVYPNPVENTVNITGIAGITTLYFYDVVGKLILEKEVANNTELDISRLPNELVCIVNDVLLPASDFAH